MTPPAFFDLQVNGYGGVDFNQDDLTPDALHHACERLEADGVAGILATVITDHLDRMSRRLSNLVRLRDADPLATIERLELSEVSHRAVCWDTAAELLGLKDN